MKFFLNYLLIVICILFSANALADKGTTMVVNFINLSSVTVYATIENNRAFMLGPIVEKNGGRASMSPTVDNIVYPGVVDAQGTITMCQGEQGYLSLNPANYSADPIFITMSFDQNYHLQCLCTGSACNYGISL